MSLTGILLDVSGSMESNIGSGTDEEGGPWARSIFQVIDDLIEHDVSSDNRVFAIGFGADCSKNIFDIISTVKEINKPATNDHVEQVLKILESNGARNVRNWTTVDLIKSEVSDVMAAVILKKLQSDTQFLRKFVDEFLPRACRDNIAKVPSTTEMVAGVVLGLGAFIASGGFAALPVIGAAIGSRVAAPYAEDAASSALSRSRPATAEDIKEVMKKVEGCLKGDDQVKCSFLKDVDRHSIFSVRDASRIIRGCVGEQRLTAERSRELLKNVEPYIYGRTPLYKSIDKAIELFQHSECRKLLFVFSDGKPTDGRIDDAGRIEVKKLEKVTVVSCFITKLTDIEPKRLYDMPNDWEAGAKFLFSLSSIVPTQRVLPRAILLRRGWTIDIANNETKLFIQVNHPDNLKEACDMTKEVVYSAEALSELLVSVDLDLYINQSTGGFEAQEQEKETCYANASAAVLHLAMKRILGRKGGYPDFHALRKEMIEKFGDKGANTKNVLKEICPKYRLQCEEVDVDGAMEAIVKKRPVVATFRLTEQCTCCGNNEWNKFSRFYKRNGSGILTKKELDVSKRCPNAPLGGHAVVLTSFSSQCLKLMNSWGSKWGDKGFFRVQDAGVLQLKFYDVYWTLNDLKPEEKAYYRTHGSEVARKLMKSLKGLQKREYTCPKCKKQSLVTEFSGTLSQVKCPKCHRSFSTQDGQGNILALNMYLTSLSG